MDLNPKKILVIQHKQLGDVVLTTPIVRVLKKHYPDAHISFLTEAFCYQILEGNPHIDEIILLDKKKLPTIFSQLKFYLGIRKKKFDLILDFFQNPRSTIIAFLSGAKTTVSYNHTMRRFFYKIKVPLKGEYAADHKLSMLEGIGIKSSDNYPEIYVPQRAEDYIDYFFKSIGIKEGDFIVCIDSTHKRITRKWTIEGFANFTGLLCKNYGAKVILLWGPGEKEYVQKIKELCKYDCFISCETDLKQLAALIKKSHILIGNDSAPRHIAVSQNPPSLTILGSTTSTWTHPDNIHKNVSLRLDCQPCRKKTCKYDDIRCMTELTAGKVLDALQSFVDVDESLKYFLTRDKKEAAG
jgi:ADP-heptose:LPS heptosyltransferase